MTVYSEYRINGDLCSDKGPIEYDDDIHVLGCIKKGSQLKCHHLTANEVNGAQIDTTGDIIVEKGITGAVINAMGNIDVRLGIVASEVKDHGNITARNLTETKIIAYGDIKIRKGLQNTDIVTSGACHVKGEITRSRILSLKGIYAKEIKSVDGVPNELRVGIDANAKLRIDEIEKKITYRNRQLTTFHKELSRLENKQNDIIKQVVESVQHQEQLNRQRGLIFDMIKELNRNQSEKEEFAIFDEEELKQLNEQISNDELMTSDLFKSQESLSEEIEELKAKIHKTEMEIEVDKTDIAKITGDDGIPTVQVSGSIDEGTVIQGIFARKILTETYWNVQIKEVKTSKFSWELQIFSNEDHSLLTS